MKKSIFAIAALAMSMAFAACGNTTKGGDADSTKNAEGEAAEQKECCEGAEQKECCDKTTADLQELQAPKAEDFASEEEYKSALEKYEAKVAEKYNEGKQVVEEKVQQVQETVEAVQAKVDEGKQAVENVKENVEAVKQDVENTKKGIEAVGNAIKGLK